MEENINDMSPIEKDFFERFGRKIDIGGEQICTGGQQRCEDCRCGLPNNWKVSAMDILEHVKKYGVSEIEKYPHDILLYILESEKENERLQKYRNLVKFIANDYHELSYEKAQWQRDDWKKRCRKLMQEVETD